MTKEELAKLVETVTKQGEELASLKRWKTKCDRAALKWGSFAMGVLSLGALLVIGLDWLREKVPELLKAWLLK